ncbi:MAG: hypothetical protein P8J27_05000 [Mariniblastus sp.]|nr:hypothetical protein [Mariniblastus sp.]
MDDQQKSIAAEAIRETMLGTRFSAWNRGMLGAVIGGTIGWFVYFMLLGQGLDALMLPGTLVGLGFGLLSKRTMMSAGWVCAVLGLALMLCCEWKSLLAFKDKPLMEFLSNLPELNTGSKIMLGFGTLMAFWFGRGR